MMSIMMRTTIWDGITMNKHFWIAALLWAASGLASAQLGAEDPDWKESEVPPPPAFDLKKLIPVEMSVQSELKWGIDPASVKIGRDGVVRYVVVAQSASGVVNAMYEGIRCSKAEFRRYARHNPGSGWVLSSSSEWMPFRNTNVSRHPAVLARNGMCDVAAPPTTVKEALDRLNAGSSARQQP
jgi:CNP1-like family